MVSGIHNEYPTRIVHGDGIRATELRGCPYGVADRAISGVGIDGTTPNDPDGMVPRIGDIDIS